MNARSHTFPLRLPTSLRDAVERIAREDGTSMNQFVVTALAEKISAMRTAEYFAERKIHPDLDTFDKVMNRQGGQPPSSEDAL